jgi:hypothetical protein
MKTYSTASSKNPTLLCLFTLINQNLKPVNQKNANQPTNQTPQKLTMSFLLQYFHSKIILQEHRLTLKKRAKTKTIKNILIKN